MWKIFTVLLLCLTRLSFARPSGAILPAYEELTYEPTIVGHSLLQVPTAVSHQSQTIVHEKRPYLRPIIEHQPVLHTSYYPATAAVPLTYASDLYAGSWSPSSYVSGSYYGGYQPWLTTK